ncbi:TauD/TfdA dioxygenase family protein [Bradyrhizobium acaciae]|uniref:TauD/TfdA dioxygenase family protein n=1 Tax=Bradyrhizobium acaciae TaxID=2683706 RepID=UPI001E365426|nr:TauD/TfdA family dioxygenase [Bradyrhizobium acaciae]MCC8980930.1 TauD/TfdA family dioxygenase [Bradyrhizobium acaciae]
MAYETIEVRKTTPTIGAEIFGVDLSQQLSNRQFDEIHRALMENLVIFFRDQQLTVEQQKAFGARFGKLHVHPNAPKGLPNHPEILVIKADENSKRVAGESWHSDVSCDEEPPMGSILYIQEIPPDGGGDTMFANMYEAYESLSEPLRKMLDGLTAIHDSWKAHSDRKPGEGSDMQFPRFEHPVVRVHPETGRKLLFVDRGFTTNIVQLRRAESDALLSFLFQHIETPKLSCRFKWQKNSIAFWDNRSAQHQAIFDYWPHRRYGHRVTICGDKPFGVAGRTSNASLAAS